MQDFLICPLKVDLISFVIDDLKVQSLDLVFNILSGIVDDILQKFAHSATGLINKLF